MPQRTNLYGAYMEIAERCSHVPFLRIGQFWSNFSEWLSQTCGKDIFYLPDDELLFYVDKFVAFMITSSAHQMPYRGRTYAET